MDNYHSDLLNKMEVIYLKHHVISMVQAIQFDGVYDIKDCLIDLNKLLITLDEWETSYKFILKKQPSDRLQEVEELCTSQSAFHY